MAAYTSRFAGRIVDAHTHFSESGRDDALHVLETTGVDVLVNLWDLNWPPRDFLSWYWIWRDLIDEGRMVVFHAPSLDNVGEEGWTQRIVREIEDAFTAGAGGLKVWKNLGLWQRDHAGELLEIDDPRLAPVWELAAEYGRPIAIHIADPKEFFLPLDDNNDRREELLARPDWWWGQGDHPEPGRLYERLENVLSNFRATTFIGVHFGCFLAPSEVLAWLSRHENLYVDTAAQLIDIARFPETASRIFNEYPERVLFGSDTIRTGKARPRVGHKPSNYDMPTEEEYPGGLPDYYENYFRFLETRDTELSNPLPFQGEFPEGTSGLGLDDHVLRLVYSDNARRLLGVS